ncbi:MAG: AgmX/PglI C-terminal domain-containing protein [Oligoflexia bacterium]|nr:AgmX/PglI C-terminal domain-containing protein [Oligoflexia bacterium]
MKILTVSRSKLELTRAHLRKPLITIGRSPTCDVVLRAPGIKAIHFLIEWIGAGEFDSSQGAWAIVDIGGGADSAEGIVLSTEPVQFGDLLFSCIEDKLESKEVIGGRILENLETSAKSGGAEILELVQVRVDSGAIEEVSHLPLSVARRGRPERVLEKVPEMQVEWAGASGVEELIRVLLDEMPGAEVFNRGQKLVSARAHGLKSSDVLQIRWRGRDFYLRFVEEVVSPPIERDVVGDPLLKRLIRGILLAAFLFLLVLHFLPKPEPEEPPPPRIATVEVPPPPKAETPPPPPELPKAEPPKEEPPKEEPKKVEPPKQKEPPKPVKQPKPVLDTKAPAVKRPAKAAAPRFETKPAPKPKAGLNSPASTVKDVNSVGILGALKSAPAKGKGVRADNIINEGIVTESVSGQEEAKIVLRNPPSGTLGTGTGGSPRGTEKADLSAASTTLAGAGKYDPNSVGPIASKGGASGYNIGSGLADGGVGTGSGKDIGAIESGAFNVEGGGLDRETVRRVIASYRGQIRTCYERALLSDSNLAGRVVYHWRISADGTVVSSEIMKSTLSSDSLRACVLEVIRKMAFPRATNGKSTRVIYPFVFQGKR